MDIEKNITNIELSEKEILLVNKILSHEKLNGIIENNGFEITYKN